jgi:hypothetical protein
MIDAICPRCGKRELMQTYAPCSDCRAELRANVRYPVFDEREPDPEPEHVIPLEIIQPDGTVITVPRPEPGPCEHCGPTGDPAVCACGCSGYEEFCGCPKCYVTHWRSAS